MTYGLKPEITKEDILNHVTPAEIFRSFTGVKPGRNVKSPLRKDRSPSFTWCILRNGMCTYKDLATSEYGDCFDFVSKLYNTRNFKDVLNIIGSRFNIEGSVNIESNPVNHNVYHKVESMSGQKPIYVEKKPFNEIDFKYWRSFGIGVEQLKKYKVIVAERAWIDKRLVYKNGNPYDPCYAYALPDQFKLYMPARNKPRPRFLTTSRALQGYEQLPEEGENLVITKSLKDIMLFDVLGIPAVAPQSESVLINGDLMRELSDRFTNKFTLFDNDIAGRRATIKYINAYPELIPLLLPKQLEKDLTDLSRKRGIEYVKRVRKRTETILKNKFYI